MGRKSKLKLQEAQLIEEQELTKCLGDIFSSLNNHEKHDFALSLFQFTKLIYDNY
jgi:hypothetical protein